MIDLSSRTTFRHRLAPAAHELIAGRNPGCPPLIVALMAATLVAVAGCQLPQAGPPDEKPPAQECGTDAELCAARAKNCGPLTATDTCGQSRKLECGTCLAPLSCGGRGVANVCGVSCQQSCPAGFTCNQVGVCAGGSLSNVTLDVKGVQLSGTVTLNGRTPADGIKCSSYPDVTKARVTLTDSASGTSVSAAIACRSGSYAWSLLAPPGTYRVLVNGFGTDYTALPEGLAGIGTPLSVSAAQSNVVLDVKGVQLSGTVTLNGRIPADGTKCPSYPDVTKARITLTDSANGTSVSSAIACRSSSYAWSLLAPPGTYQVLVNGFGTDYTALPEGIAGIGIPLSVSAAQSNVVVDVKGVQLSGTVALNGRTPADGSKCPSYPDVTKARVTLTDSANGTSVSSAIACRSSSYAWSLLAPPGTYQVLVNGFGTDYTALPEGLAGIGTPLSVSVAQSNVVLDVKGVQLSGTVTLNGRTPTDGTKCPSYPDVTKARVTLTDSASRTSVSAAIACRSSSYAWTLWAPPGTYRVLVNGFGTDYTALPEGIAGIGTPLSVSAAQSNVVLDVKGVQLSGTVTLNGRTPADGTKCPAYPDVTKARVTLTDSANGTSVSSAIACRSGSYAWSLWAPPGTYRTLVNGFGTDYTALPEGIAGSTQLAIP